MKNELIKISVSEFNENISKWLDKARDGEVVFITLRGRTIVTILGKKDFDAIVMQAAKTFDEEELDAQKQK